MIMLVRDGTVLPHIALAQSTTQMDWTKLELRVFAVDKETRAASGLVCLPTDNALTTVTLERNAAGSLTPGGDADFALRTDPFGGRVKWAVRKAEITR